VPLFESLFQRDSCWAVSSIFSFSSTAFAQGAEFARNFDNYHLMACKAPPAAEDARENDFRAQINCAIFTLRARGETKVTRAALEQRANIYFARLLSLFFSSGNEHFRSCFEINYQERQNSHRFQRKLELLLFFYSCHFYKTKRFILGEAATPVTKLISYNKILLCNILIN